jgi:hypothetical protein
VHRDVASAVWLRHAPPAGSELQLALYQPRVGAPPGTDVRTPP